MAPEVEAPGYCWMGVSILSPHQASTDTSYLLLQDPYGTSPFIVLAGCRGLLVIRLCYFSFFGWREQTFLGASWGLCLWILPGSSFSSTQSGAAKGKRKCRELTARLSSGVMTKAVLPPRTPHFSVSLSLFCIWCLGFLVVLSGKKRENYVCCLFAEMEESPLSVYFLLFSLWGLTIFKFRIENKKRLCKISKLSGNIKTASLKLKFYFVV